MCRLVGPAEGFGVEDLGFEEAGFLGELGGQCGVLDIFSEDSGDFVFFDTGDELGELACGGVGGFCGGGVEDAAEDGEPVAMGEVAEGIVVGDELAVVGGDGFDLLEDPLVERLEALYVVLGVFGIKHFIAGVELRECGVYKLDDFDSIINTEPDVGIELTTVVMGTSSVMGV